MPLLLPINEETEPKNSFPASRPENLSVCVCVRERELSVMEKNTRMVLLLGLLLATFLVCHGARDIPTKPKPYQPQNVFGFGGVFPGPVIGGVFPGPGIGGSSGTAPGFGLGGMPGFGSFPGIGGTPLFPGGGVVGGNGAVKP